MNDTITLILQTPEHKVEISDLWQIILPGQEGEMGILPNHAPMLVELKTDLITTIPSRPRFFVVGGIAYITRHACHVKTVHFEDTQHIDISKLEAEIDSLSQEMLQANAFYKHALLDQLTAKNILMKKKIL